MKLLPVSLCVLTLCWTCVKTENQRPIIGILAQESDQEWSKYGNSYIESPYVGFLEQAGARVVPIRIKEADHYYVDIFSKINGILFPGGGVSLTTSGYAQAAKKIYRMAIEANDRGDHFPLWGTCLGFQQLSVLTAGVNLLKKCSGVSNAKLPLHFISGYKESRLIRGMPSRYQALLALTNITFNGHNYCLDYRSFHADSKLNKFYRLISTNKDANGLEFVSTMEAYNYPFYGTQWHAEKNNWDWDVKDDIDHSLASTEISQYLANFFVQSARNSSHHFPSLDEESETLIESATPVYLGQPLFFSLYMFNFTVLSEFEIEDYPMFSATMERVQFFIILLGMAFLLCTLLAMLRRFYRNGALLSQSKPRSKRRPKDDLDFTGDEPEKQPL